MNQNSIVENLVEVTLAEKEDFLKVKETLTRIGIPSRTEKKLVQSCHILHKQGKYYIVHFLEMFALDGKNTTFTEADRARRNTIANLLEEWELLKIVNHDQTDEPQANMSKIKVIPYSSKNEWTLVSKYTVGKVRR